MANTNVGRRVGVIESLLLHPFKGAIVAFVYMNNDLVLMGRIPNDAFDTAFQKRKIVPRRNDDGEYKFLIGTFVRVKRDLGRHARGRVIC